MKKSYGDKIKFRIFDGLNIVLMSVMTGLFVGVVITLYNILAEIGEDKSQELYALVFENPAFVPLLLGGLAAGGIVIGTAVKFVPMIKGSGIPQIEGAARGVVHFKWYVVLCSMFAASLACIFMGASAGAEGPSLQIGGCCGDATAHFLRRKGMTRRLQIGSGASAGLAVAFNAPVTGLMFALEEAFRSFSPRVFVSAALSVVVALLTRNAIRPSMGYSVGFSFHDFVFCDFSAVDCLWIALAAVICGFAGVGFYHLTFILKKFFGKFNFLKGCGNYVIFFVLAGAFGLITPYVMGGGHSFIQALATGGTGEISISQIFGIGVLATIIIITIIKFITASLAMSIGVPCGVFIPMLAVGAGLGGVLSIIFTGWGMNAALTDYFVIICMAVFFTSIVRAPITGIVMIFELTGQFTNFLPALIGIAIGYLISFLMNLTPIYERSLKEIAATQVVKGELKKITFVLNVQANSYADGKTIRSIIWPVGGLVTEKISGDTSIVPSGRTTLEAGDTIVFSCMTQDEEQVRTYLEDLVGEIDEI